MVKTVVIITGGFDPIHSGHLNYIKAASKLGDILVVGVNSDEWLVRKKGRSFMSYYERSQLITAINGVSWVWAFDDSDDSGKHIIQLVRKTMPDAKIIFANGGDRTADNIPEMDIKDNNLEFVFGVGGIDKANSSSHLLREWKVPKTNRDWGYYRVLHEPSPEVKLKELVVYPGQRLSMQRHFNRSELWFVTEGTATLITDNNRVDKYEQFSYINIPVESWHQLCNNTPDPLKIIEIQYGAKCIEEDIERIES